MKNEFMTRIRNTKSDNTIKIYQKVIDILPSIPRPADIDNLIQGWHGASKNTIRLRLTVISLYLKFIRNRMEVPQYDEMQDYLKSYRGEKKNPKIPTEIENVIQNSNMKYKLITGLGAYAGLRVSEIVNLNVNDIGNEFITIRNTKSKQDRIVPIPSPLREILSQFSKQSLEIALKTNSKTVWSYLHRKFNLHPHQLRHFYATQLVQNDVNLETVRTVLGHKSLTTTQRYIHLTGNKIKSDVLGVFG